MTENRHEKSIGVEVSVGVRVDWAVVGLQELESDGLVLVLPFMLAVGFVQFGYMSYLAFGHISPTRLIGGGSRSGRGVSPSCWCSFGRF